MIDLVRIPSLQHRVRRLDNARYHGARRDLSLVRFLLLHGTAGESFASSVGWMNADIDPDGEKGPKGKVSYHYGVERDGTIPRMTPPEVVSYGAGDSAWPGPRRHPPGNGSTLNPVVINIAMALRKGEAPTEVQFQSTLWLCRFWMNRLDFPPSAVRGHYEVSPGRKFDPLENCVEMGWFREELSKVVLI